MHLRHSKTIAITLAISFIAGCGILAPDSEKAAKARQAAVQKEYRPGEVKLPELAATASYETYLRYALLNSPTVQAAYFNWLSAIERITVARSLPDPRLTFQMDIQNGIPSLMPGLQFDIPGPGKLTAAANIAAAGSEAQYYAYVRACQQTAFDLEKSIRELTFINRKLAALRESMQLLIEIEQLAQGLNATSQATIQDVIQAQIEQERRRTEIRNLETAKIPAMEKFRAALGIAANQPLPPLPTKLPVLPETPEWSQKFLSQAMEHNPELQAMRSDIVQAEANLDMAYKGNIPDFTAGAELDARAVPVLVRPMASMTLPIWREKIAAAIAAAQAAKQSADAKLAAGRISLAVNFAEKSYLLKEAAVNLETLRSQLLPQSRLAVIAARGAYAAAKVDFQTILQAEKNRLNFEVEEAAMILQYHVSLSDLYLLIAGETPVAAKFATPPGK